VRRDHPSVLPIRILGDPVLRERCREVDTFDELLAKLAEDMIETMYRAPGVGLAAPQVGLSLRFFVYDDGRGSGPHAVANPVLSSLVGEETIDEGCLSIPNLYFPARRATGLRLEGQDLDGGPLTVEAEELLARIFQHETDHLDGMLFVDRLDREERRQAMAAIREAELEGLGGAWVPGGRPARSPRA
jgi:peptide deformylase